MPTQDGILQSHVQKMSCICYKDAVCKFRGFLDKWFFEQCINRYQLVLKNRALDIPGRFVCLSTKGKNLVPRGTFFFPFRGDPFSEWRQKKQQHSDSAGPKDVLT